MPKHKVKAPGDDSNELNDAGELTPKMLLFAYEWPNGWNGTQAAIRAGYPPARAAYIAMTLTRDPRVRKLVDAGVQARIDALGITKDRILKELMAIAFQDKRKAARWRNETTETLEEGRDGVKVTQHVGAHIELTPSDELDDESAAAITGIKMGKYGPEVSFASKEQALQLLGKELGMFKDKVEHSVDESLSALVAASLMGKPKDAE